jgi:hypothetical protein
MGASVTVTGASSVVTLTAHDDLTPRASITAPGGISLLAKRAISDSTSATRVFTVSGSGNPILFAADTDNTGGGNIYLVGINTFTTSGGAITFGGANAAGSSYATGYADSSLAGGGVVFNGATTMTSSGGNITLRGQSTVSTNAGGWYGFGVGFINGNASLNSGSGKIYIEGKTRIDAGSTWRTGVGLGSEGSGAVTITSASSDSDAIVIIGDAAASRVGIAVTAGVGDRGLGASNVPYNTISTTAGGGITVTGYGQTIGTPGSYYGWDAASESEAVYLYGTRFSVTGGAGNVTLTGSTSSYGEGGGVHVGNISTLGNL